MVEFLPSKQAVVGSNPISRSNALIPLTATELLGRTIGAFIDHKEVLQAERFEKTIQRVDPDASIPRGPESRAG